MSISFRLLISSILLLLTAACTQAAPTPTVDPTATPLPTSTVLPTNTPQPTATPHPTDLPPTPTPSWELVWRDEFDGDQIDLTKWTYDTGGNGFGNNEEQYYTREDRNSRVEDGYLIIEAHEEDYRFKDYTSAKLWTLAQHSWLYGRIEINAKLPEGQGIWPAFWMLPNNYTYGNWPHSGEIDIMELVGHEPNTIHGTLHYTDGGGRHKYTGDQLRITEHDLSETFHTYAIEWEEGEIRWYFDGEMYAQQKRWQSGENPHPAPFDHEFILILNLAIGGNWPGSPDETTQFPQQMLVDSVRVYQREP